jgi:FKBP-type peptidyl-prolyl cis-trans isomerase FkpA
MRISIIVAVLLFLSFMSCKTDMEGFIELDNGLKYKFIEQNEGKSKPEIGDVLVLNLSYKNKDGEIVFESSELERTYLRKHTESTHPGGSLEDALAMMHIGDSAIFKINAANFYRFSEEFENLPDGIDPTEEYYFHIRLIEIMKKEEFDSFLMQKYHEDEDTELELLQNYLNRVNVDKESKVRGIYYVERKEGSGDLIKTGDMVEIFYTGKFIDGQIFDSNYGSSPLSFKVGMGHVIPGMDIGIQLMKPGGEAMLIIPSRLGYGAKGAVGIMPYSSLIFDIEIINVQAI